MIESRISNVLIFLFKLNISNFENILVIDILSIGCFLVIYRARKFIKSDNIMLDNLELSVIDRSSRLLLF